jgi:hypothetical protein
MDVQQLRNDSDSLEAFLCLGSDSRPPSLRVAPRPARVPLPRQQYQLRVRERGTFTRNGTVSIQLAASSLAEVRQLWHGREAELVRVAESRGGRARWEAPQLERTQAIADL